MRAALAAVLVLSACAPSQTAAPPTGVPATTALPPAAGPATAIPRGTASPAATPTSVGQVGVVVEFPVTVGSAPHDVAPAADGGVWYTAQRTGRLGHLDPRTGRLREIALGAGSSPHGVIVDRDGVAWVTDSGLNAIVSVDPRNGDAVRRFPLSAGTPNVNMNTAVIDGNGTLWWTGQNGWYGSLKRSGNESNMGAYQAPRGRGPYGITVTPEGAVFYASLAGNHIARVDPATERATPIDPPTAGQGSRRVWSDSKGNVWVSEYNAGQVARYDPKAGSWKEWKLPGSGALAYSVYVDDQDKVWLTDFRAHAIVRFDPATEQFTSFPHAAGGNVRQMLGRPGEVWGALSAHDKLVVIRTR